ncbi:PEROXISOMAL MEMBRANE PROTEIN 2 PXMP2 MPV17 [Salix koriyanagi]|uniref:PEROXISOMAL MEMBRANE PROTEIN 2 PXMP2 MPV17 n=1 Tax=Salix koriyanagi TaxID=2511006 RepID=A0A9Q0X1P9_9ROSI|nr:PEROXISOMAL MEMBRANE PROTEIN 2 PXMP2 MPV17 [Salix koriyanagi]
MIIQDLRVGQRLLAYLPRHGLFLTKSAASSLTFIAADCPSSQTISLPSSEPYDLERTLRMAGYGLLVIGPSLHFWFGFVSKLLPERDLVTTFKKILMGQTIYEPIMTVVFFSLNARLQGENSAEIIAWLKRDSLPTTINGVMYRPVCDFVKFKFILVRLQAVYMTFTASLEKPAQLLQLMGSILTTSFLQQNYVS